MLELAVLILVLLNCGLAWAIYRLFSVHQRDFEMDAAVERAIYDAGWLAEYRKANMKAAEALAERRTHQNCKQTACSK
jgi:hypothetical protein